jgi:hypothetical protein
LQNEVLNGKESEELMLKKQVDRPAKMLITISSPSDDNGDTTQENKSDAKSEIRNESVLRIIDSDSDSDMEETENISDEAPESATFNKPNAAENTRLPTILEATLEMDESVRCDHKLSPEPSPIPKYRYGNRYNNNKYDFNKVGSRLFSMVHFSPVQIIQNFYGVQKADECLSRLPYF